MIELMGLNGSVIYLNYFQIMCIEEIPETKVTLYNGRYYLVKDSVESVQRKINIFLHSCITSKDRDVQVKEQQ